jgi:cytoskeletal protein RodZ
MEKINSENLVINEKKTSEIIINENLDNKVVNNTEDRSNISLEPNTLTETSISNETSAIANERTPKEEMVLKSSGNSWVEIEDLDGNSYLTRLMRSGETFVVPDKKGLTLSTGNAGVLSLTFGSTHISKLGSVGEVISSRPLNIEAFKKR